MLAKNKLNELSADTIFSVVLLIACPALAIISALFHIYRERYNHLTILSLGIALFTLFIPPFADIYRHTLLYFHYGNYEWSGLYQTNEHDFIFYSLTHLFAQYDIPFEFISFLFVFICYQISFYLFRQVIAYDTTNRWGRNTRFIIFLCFLFMVPFIAIVNGLRMATAAYIGVLGWYCIYNRHKIRGILLFLIACGMHFGSLLFIPLIVYTILSRINIGRYVFIIGIVILMSLGNVLLYVIPTEYIAALELEDQVTGYMIESVERFDDTMSFNGLIAMFLERSPLIVIGLLAIFNKLNIDKRSLSVTYFVIWLAFLYFPFTVLFQRYAFFAIPILVFLAVRENTLQSSSCSNHKIIIALSCIVMTLSYIYGYRDPYRASKYHKMLYPAVYTIPTTDTRENFRDALVPKE